MYNLRDTFYIQKKKKNNNQRHKLTVDLGTLPRKVMFFLAFSLAIRILCFGAIFNSNEVYVQLSLRKRYRYIGCQLSTEH